MDSHVLVRPEHLNHHGNLFGGQLLLWVDEYAWIAASLDFPTTTFVTVGMGESSFKVGINLGAIIRFSVKLLKKGNSSVTYKVDVYARHPDTRGEVLSFTNTVVFVAIDKDGKKIPLPK